MSELTWADVFDDERGQIGDETKVVSLDYVKQVLAREADTIASSMSGQDESTLRGLRDLRFDLLATLAELTLLQEKIS